MSDNKTDVSGHTVTRKKHLVNVEYLRKGIQGVGGHFLKIRHLIEAV